VQQFRYNGNENQLWRIERLGGGTYRIVNIASGKCLDVEGGGRQDGSRIIQYKCQGTENQAWRLGD
ncbi:MAG: RICIN domain-containing protein, partial [Thermoanaerobaculia bacterium]